MSANTSWLAGLPLLIALAGNTLAPTTTGPAPASPTTHTRAALATTPATLTPGQQTWQAEHLPWGAPAYNWPGSRSLIVREGHALSHNNVDRIADWVAFRLTRDFVRGTETRPSSSAFKPDPLLLPGSRAELDDYRGSGYDRGHQCASGDSKGRGNHVTRESFLLSNMTPQVASLNRGPWRVLEETIRGWADSRGELWVITGPAFVDGDGDGVIEYEVIGSNEVAVPTHYYKVVLARDSNGDLEAIAFLIPNERMQGTFTDHLTSIDEIEAQTGLDFLTELPDPVEDALESGMAQSMWN